MEKTYEVKGMTCVICKGNVEKTLNNIKGVNSAKVNLLENEVTINYDENITNELIFKKEIDEAGYKLIIDKKKEFNFELIKLIISVILVVILMYVSMNLTKLKYLQLILSTIIIILNINIYISGFKALIKHSANMNSLVFISSFVAYLYSLYALFINKELHLYFETSAMVLTIVTLGKYIEKNTKTKTTKVIRGLATLIPMQANLLVGNNIKVIKIEDLKKNDIVRVNPGESIPQDGIIINGSTSINESMITGESLLVEKNIDDSVIGGTINMTGSIDVKITKHSNMTVLSNIINLTKKSSMAKIPIERLTDKIAKYFVYVVLSISLITFIIWMIISKDIELSLNFSLSVLVVSCPCALGLATPAAITVASGKAAKNGILIKKMEVLEIISKTKNIIFDKTGTLTKNNLEIVEIKQLDDEFINVLSSIEKTSNHPISKTILNRFNDGNIIFETSEFIASKGLKATLNNDIYLAGNNALMKIDQSYIDYGINNNYSYIGVSKNNKLLGIVYLSDVIRDSSFKAVNNLIKRNINPIMCTGDNQIAAKSIADKLNIKEYLFNVLPQDKDKLVLEKKNEGIVMMVGDGVNDAIALTNADVSITVSEASDIASATSDIVLMKSDLNDISFIYDLSKKTMRVIKQNLFWALLYNSLLIPIAAGALYSFKVILNPMLGSIAMWISSMFVLINALRINNVQKEDNQ